MHDKTSENLIADAAKANGEFSASLRQVLNGYIAEMGGPQAWGHELARMAKDEEVPVSSRVSLHNNALRLTAQLDAGEEDGDLIDDEQLEAQAAAIITKRRAQGNGS